MPVGSCPERCFSVVAVLVANSVVRNGVVSFGVCCADPIVSSYSGAADGTCFPDVCVVLNSARSSKCSWFIVVVCVDAVSEILGGCRTRNFSGDGNCIEGCF